MTAQIDDPWNALRETNTISTLDFEAQANLTQSYLGRRDSILSNESNPGLSGSSTDSFESLPSTPSHQELGPRSNALTTYQLYTPVSKNGGDLSNVADSSSLSTRFIDYGTPIQDVDFDQLSPRRVQPSGMFYSKYEQRSFQDPVCWEQPSDGLPTPVTTYGSYRTLRQRENLHSPASSKGYSTSPLGFSRPMFFPTESQLFFANGLNPVSDLSNDDFTAARWDYRPNENADASFYHTSVPSQSFSHQTHNIQDFGSLHIQLQQQDDCLFEAHDTQTCSPAAVESSSFYEPTSPAHSSKRKSPISGEELDGRRGSRKKTEVIQKEPMSEYLCSKCGKRFRRGEHRKRHDDAVHQQTKRFICAIGDPLCKKDGRNDEKEKGINRRDNQLQHYTTHLKNNDRARNKCAGFEFLCYLIAQSEENDADLLIYRLVRALWRSGSRPGETDDEIKRHHQSWGAFCAWKQTREGKEQPTFDQLAEAVQKQEGLDSSKGTRRLPKYPAKAPVSRSRASRG